MRYLSIIAISILIFLAVGWGVSFFAVEKIEPQDEEVELALVLTPIGVGAALGLLVGLIASILTVIDRRSKHADKAPPKSGS